MTLYLVPKHAQESQQNEDHEHLGSRPADLPVHDEGTQEEDRDAAQVPVEAEDDGVGPRLRGKLLHHHWIQPKANLEEEEVVNTQTRVSGINYLYAHTRATAMSRADRSDSH